MRGVLAFLLVTFGLTTSAWAHSTLVAVDPPDGAVLPVAPRSLDLRFNEPIRPAVVRVIDAQGHVREDASFVAHDDTVHITLPADLPQGTQVVSYRIISADGHPVSGAVMFSIGAPNNPGSRSDTNSSLDVAIWFGRVGLYLGLFVGIGGVFFMAWLAPDRPARRPIAAALSVGAAAAVISMGLQGLDLLGLDGRDLASARPWIAGWQTSLGPSLATALGGMGLAGWAIHCSGRWTARLIASVALLTVGGTLVLSGHASTAAPVFLTKPAIFVHGLCIAFWIGALAPLSAMALRSAPELRHTLETFSDLAMPLVGVLVLTGLALASVQMESLSAFRDTPYGRILAVKLLAVAGLLALAAFNRFRFMTQAKIDARPIRRSILAEGALALTIFGLVAGWRFTVPPRTLAAVANAEPVYAHFMTAKVMIDIAIRPGRVGPNALVFGLTDIDGRAMPSSGVTVTLTQPTAGIDAVERHAALGADGLWHVDDILVPQPGRWHVRVDVLVSDFQQETVEDDVLITG